MDYSKLSDFKINSAVFEAIHEGAPDYKEGDDGAMVLLSFEGDVVNGDAVEVEVDRGRFNPCNNPSDAWPIIAENNISIIFDNPSMTMATSNCVGWYSDEDPPIHASSSNPLRAAMIVFLKMQESANVPANPAGPDIR